MKISLKPTYIFEVVNSSKPLVGRAFSLAATFLLSIVVARNLSISDAGEFFLFVTTVFALSTFSRLGVDNLALKLGNSNKSIDKEKLKASLFLAIMLSLITSMIFLAFLLFSVLFFENVSLIVKVAVSSTVLSICLFLICSALLRAKGYISSGSFLELGLVPLTSSLSILILKTLNLLNLSTALLAFSLSTWIAASLSIVYLFEHFKIVKTKKIRRHLTDKQHLFSLSNTMFSNLLLFGVTWAPLFLLSLAGNEESAALYYVAVRFANIVGLMPSIQGSYLGPKFSKFLQENEISKLNSLTKTSSNRVLVFGVFLSLGISIMAWLLIPSLYGRNFHDAIPATILLTFGTLVVNSMGQVNLLLLLSGLELVSACYLLGIAALWALLGGVTFHIETVMVITSITVFTSILYALISSITLRKVMGIKSYARFVE